MDLLASKGSAGEDKNPHTIRQFPADAKLLAIAESVKGSYAQGKVVEGVIGSADVWNSELDRIRDFREKYHTSVEEMETASAAQIAAAFNIPLSAFASCPTILPTRVNTIRRPGLRVRIMSTRW